MTDTAPPKCVLKDRSNNLIEVRHPCEICSFAVTVRTCIMSSVFKAYAQVDFHCFQANLAPMSVVYFGCDYTGPYLNDATIQTKSSVVNANAVLVKQWVISKVLCYCDKIHWQLAYHKVQVAVQCNNYKTFLVQHAVEAMRRRQPAQWRHDVVERSASARRQRQLVNWLHQNTQVVQSRWVWACAVTYV